MNSKTILRHGLILGLLILACSSSVVAQQAAEPVITANIKCLSLERDLAGVDILAAKNKRLPVHAASAYISTAVQYQGPAQLTFVRAKKKGVNESAAGLPEDKPEVLGSVELPATGGDYLLLFAGSAETKLQIMAVPFSSSDVPFGSCMVWNITHRALGVVMGGQRALLNPSQKQTFTPSLITKDYFDLRVFDEYEGKSRPLVGGPHFLPEKTRQLIFIAERFPGGAPIQIKVVEEMPEVKSRPKLDAQLTALSR
jgi:hypothetical protein